jgi:hypothetical protein
VSAASARLSAVGRVLLRRDNRLGLQIGAAALAFFTFIRIAYPAP